MTRSTGHIARPGQGHGKPRPNFKDVVRIASVGTATVDRVLNERGNVSEAVRRKVIEAARSIGLRRQLPAAYKPLIRINLIIVRPDLPILARIAADFRSNTKSIDRRVSLHITTLPNDAPNLSPLQCAPQTATPSSSMPRIAP